MPINSREKGARFERLYASILRKHGFSDARRGQQFCGANGDPDVVGIPGVHLELKAVEALNIKKAMDQSIRDAKDGEIPVVVHKKNREPIMVTMLNDDFLKLIKGAKPWQVDSKKPL